MSVEAEGARRFVRSGVLKRPLAGAEHGRQPTALSGLWMCSGQLMGAA